MIRINLLPEKIRAREALIKSIILAVAVVLVAVGVVGWFYVKRLAVLTEVEKQVMAVEAERNSPALKQMVDQVEFFAAQSKLYQDQKAQIDKFREKQGFWVKVLDVLPDVIGEQAWIRRLRKGEKGRLVVDGSAVTAEDVAKIYINFENHGAFKNVSLDTPPTRSNYNGMTVYQFSLSFEFEG
jgi:Tfp pilus assembly protein PilN